VARIDATPEFIQLQFVPHPPLDPAAVLKLVQKQRGWKLTGPTKLRVERVTSELVERALAVRQVLEALAQAAVSLQSPVPLQSPFSPREKGRG